MRGKVVGNSAFQRTRYKKRIPDRGRKHRLNANDFLDFHLYIKKESPAGDGNSVTVIIFREKWK